jgi:hypothetical protein
MDGARSARRRQAAWLGTVLLGIAVAASGAAGLGPGGRQARQTALPDRLSDADFWQLASDLSEPGGYFRIEDNFTSNEAEIGQVVAMLRQRGVTGGVYLGVGPEQNFSYIAGVRPLMAFIVDIRRQAALQHLMFKAVFELASDRADFISLLFAKPRPADVGSDIAIQALWNAYRPVVTDEDLAEKTWRRIVGHLTVARRIALTEAELAQMQTVYNAFVAYGPSISTRGLATGRGRGIGVTFADLTGWSTDAQGRPQSFLATPEDFAFVKGLHARNLIVPVTGDFGGAKALRAIAAYLKGRAVVNAFYVSNVEQYLFQDGKAEAFYANVAALPSNDATIFIRPYSLRRGGSTAQSLCGVTGFLAAVQAGRVASNNDALACPSK